MCGIFGVLGNKSQYDWSSNYRSMSHRGPDSSGEYSDEYCFLAHNRLSIIDLSTLANQPMRSQCGRFVIVFNGEIFNYRKLKQDLISRDIIFATQSDTEVLLQLFIQKGKEALDELDGMFAFVIYDRQEKIVFGARDHAGIKPLFLGHGCGYLGFASEIKALRGVTPLEVDESKVYEYLQYGYVPAPESIYRDVESLPPGHAFTYSLKTNEYKKWKWTQAELVQDPSLTFEDAVAVFKEKLGGSVKNRCIADVPIGVFLSGGLDSSAIVAEAQSQLGSVDTYSIGYRENSDYDETKYAKIVANHLGVSHTVIYPENPKGNLELYIERILDHFDQPFANPTVIMLYLLTSEVQAKATVALIGDGGDEILAGYSRHRALQLLDRFRLGIRPWSRLALAGFDHLAEVPGVNHGVRRMRQFFESSHRSNADAYSDWNSVFRAEELVPAIPYGKMAAFRRADNALLTRLFEQKSGDPITKALAADQNSFLPFNLMDGADRMSMANSFELRLPFLSFDLMRFVNSLPSEFKIKGRSQKRLLKEAYKDVLPREILRRPKRGFNPPVWNWLHQSKELVLDILAPGCLVEEYLDGKFIRACSAELFSMRRDTSLQVWTLLVLEKWMQREAEDSGNKALRGI